MVKRKSRKVSRGITVGGTGFTGKRPKDKPVRIGQGGFAAGVGGKGVKIGRVTKI